MLTLFAIKTNRGYYRWDKVKKVINLVPLEQASIFTPQQITELEAIMTALREKGLAVCLIELSISERAWPDISAWKHHQSG